MRFVLRMMGRELRSSWRRLLFFFVCVAIGVGAIVALRSVIQSVRGGLMREARSIIASDVLISTNRAWTDEIRRALDERLSSADVLERMEAIETATMVRPEEGAATARMVELRGVQPAFPFYGEIRLLNDVRVLARSAARPRRAGPAELLTQLGIAVGQRIVIGGHPFTVRGVIVQEPGRRVGAFSFGSRVLVDYDDLPLDRAADVRQPGQLPDPAARARAGRREPDAATSAAISATASCRHAPTDRPRTTSART